MLWACLQICIIRKCRVVLGACLVTISYVNDSRWWLLWSDVCRIAKLLYPISIYTLVRKRYFLHCCRLAMCISQDFPTSFYLRRHPAHQVELPSNILKICCCRLWPSAPCGFPASLLSTRIPSSLPCFPPLLACTVAPELRRSLAEEIPSCTVAWFCLHLFIMKIWKFLYCCLGNHLKSIHAFSIGRW